MRRFGSVLCVCVVLIAASAAQAQSREEDAVTESHDEEARRLFEAGQLAFEDGRFEDALEAFDRAFALSDRPALLYNIGLAADRLREDERALDAFERFVEAVPESPHRQRVEARIEALRAAIDRHRVESLSPREVALANSPDTPPPPAPATPLRRSWWLWTGVGVAAAAIATILVVALRQDEVQPPLDGDVGFVLRTLRREP